MKMYRGLSALSPSFWHSLVTMVRTSPSPRSGPQPRLSAPTGQRSGPCRRGPRSRAAPRTPWGSGPLKLDKIKERHSPDTIAAEDCASGGQSVWTQPGSNSGMTRGGPVRSPSVGRNLFRPLLLPLAGCTGPFLHNTGTMHPGTMNANSHVWGQWEDLHNRREGEEPPAICQPPPLGDSSIVL